jgi:fructosamine-3-kinase
MDDARAVGVALDATVRDWTELDGGEVGRVIRVDLGNDSTDGTGSHRPAETVVAKTGSTPLTVEARMLAVLRDAGVPVPEVYHASDALLVLEHVRGATPTDPSPAVEREIARHVAEMHATDPDSLGCLATAPGSLDPVATARGATARYGFPFDTLSGPYHQPNGWHADWPEFFAERRLRHVAVATRDEGSLPEPLFERVEQLCDELDGLLPTTPDPALLHGDLWHENVLVAEGNEGTGAGAGDDGAAVTAFLDPACSFGHAEVDLAYADWVGFGDAFFGAYDEAVGAGTGGSDTGESDRCESAGIDAAFWETRRDVYVCYPLVEHVRYFDGESYRVELDETLARLGY